MKPHVHHKLKFDRRLLDRLICRAFGHAFPKDPELSYCPRCGMVDEEIYFEVNQEREDIRRCFPAAFEGMTRSDYLYLMWTVERRRKLERETLQYLVDTFRIQDKDEIQRFSDENLRDFTKTLDFKIWRFFDRCDKFFGFVRRRYY